MPEFEETDPQPDPAHNYIPSKSAPKNKGGRRRSGGFKSEATPSNQKIGEVDPTEALEADVRRNTPKASDPADSETSCSMKDSKSSSSASSSDRASKSAAGASQPSKATLDSIKKVEERIANCRPEVEKNRSEKSRRSSNKRDQRERGKGNKKKGGLFSAIAQFFGSLFGGSPKDDSPRNHRSSRRKQKSGKNDPHRNGKYGRDNSNKNYKNQRGGGKRPRRRNAPQNT